MIRDKERILDMVSMRLDGATLQEIGDKYGVTRERVRQILYESFGISEPRKRKNMKNVVYPNLRDWILGRRMTMSEFSELVGITNSSLSLILNGKNDPSKRNIDKILNVTGLTYETAFQKAGSGCDSAECISQPNKIERS